MWQFLDARHLPSFAQKDVIQRIDEWIVFLHPGVIGKVWFATISRYRIGTAHGFRGGKPFHSVLGCWPFRVALVHIPRRQKPVGRSVRFDVPIPRQYVRQVPGSLVARAGIARGRQLLDVPGRQIGVDGHHLRLVEGARHVVISHGEGLAGGLVPEPHRHQLVEPVLGHVPGVLGGPSRGVVEPHQPQEGLGGRFGEAVQIDREPRHGVAIGFLGLPGPPRFPLVGEPRDVHAEDVERRCLEGDRDSHVAVESLPVQPRDEVIPPVGKMGMKGPRPVVGNLLEADDRGSLDFVVDLPQDDRESVLRTQMIRVEGGIVVRAGQMGRQNVVGCHPDLEGLLRRSCHGTNRGQAEWFREECVKGSEEGR
mmetsp:Transcript_23624/g.55973  ORF Transcript_23624/g.55973 Transcript_23624/m.55973 type:complete len:366 (-) Transcript_23624:97-1194(-)